METNGMTEEEIVGVLSINEGEDLNKKEKFIKDAIEFYFQVPDEEEFMATLRQSKMFPSLLKEEK